MTYLNLGCGPHLAPAPWINTDRNTEIYAEDFSTIATRPLERKPDVVCPSWDLPYPNESVERVYAGHLLEHLCFADVNRTLHEIQRVLAPTGTALFVGPDMVKLAEMVFQMRASWTLFWSAHGTAGRGNPNGPAFNGRPGDVHLWNSTAEAIWFACRAAFPNRPVEIIPEENIGPEWPLVARVGWQAAVLVGPSYPSST